MEHGWIKVQLHLYNLLNINRWQSLELRLKPATPRTPLGKKAGKGGGYFSVPRDSVEVFSNKVCLELPLCPRPLRGARLPRRFARCPPGPSAGAAVPGSPPAWRERSGCVRPRSGEKGISEPKGGENVPIHVLKQKCKCYTEALRLNLNLRQLHCRVCMRKDWIFKVLTAFV